MAAAPALPPVGGTGDLNLVVSDLPLMPALVGCVLVLLPARDEALPLALVALGAGLLGGAFTVAGSIPLANIAKVLFAGALGLLLARLLAEPAAVVAVPVFVAVVDVLSVAGGPTEWISHDESRTGEFLTFYLPAWGGGRAGVMGIADLVFAGYFAASAWRFGLRRRATAVALMAALPVTLGIKLLLGGTIPALPVLAAALLLVNLDLLPGLLRRRDRG
jgi:hypothetical protein